MRRRWLLAGFLSHVATRTESAQMTQAVVSFTLINADTNVPIQGFDPLPNGAELNLSTLPTPRLNIRANTTPSVVGSVRFEWDGDVYRTESGAPYAMAGDDSGNYRAWTPSLGNHTLKATPFAGTGATGAAGTAKQISLTVTASAGGATERTTVGIHGREFYLNSVKTYLNAPAEGLLLNVRMVNSVFEDTNRATFNADANTTEFLNVMGQYVNSGVRAFSLCLQGGDPNYEGAINSAFTSAGTLRSSYMARVQRVLDKADTLKAAVILQFFYQRQDQRLADDTAIRNAVVNATRWVTQQGARHVLLEIANEYNHTGFNHAILRTVPGIVSLIQLAKQTAPELYVSCSALGDGTIPAGIADAADYILLHMNGVQVSDFDTKIAAVRQFGKPILITEDPKTGGPGATAAQTAVQQGASWGFFLRANQYYPMTFRGTADDPTVYAKLRQLATP